MISARNSIISKCKYCAKIIHRLVTELYKSHAPLPFAFTFIFTFHPNLYPLPLLLPFTSSKPSPSLEDDWVEVAHEVREEPDLSPASSSSSPNTLRLRMNRWLLSVFYELVQDFSDEPIPETAEEEKEDQLAVKK